MLYMASRYRDWKDVEHRHCAHLCRCAALLQQYCSNRFTRVLCFVVLTLHDTGVKK